MEKATDKLTFEKAIVRLEEIVGTLEEGKAPLDELLGLYEEGVKLIKFCNKKLDSAEQKVKMLSKNSDGTFTEVNFNGNDDRQ